MHIGPERLPLAEAALDCLGICGTITLCTED
jgi:hypothetical protein